MKSGKQNSNWSDAQASTTVPVNNEAGVLSEDTSTNLRTAKCEIDKLGLDRNSHTEDMSHLRAARAQVDAETTDGEFDPGSG